MISILSFTPLFIIKHKHAAVRSVGCGSIGRADQFRNFRAWSSPSLVLQGGPLSTSLNTSFLFVCATDFLVRPHSLIHGTAFSLEDKNSVLSAWVFSDGTWNLPRTPEFGIG
jgi:hypothetical protein